MRLPDDNAPVWLDGLWTGAHHAGVRLTDPGLLAGIGVYETLGVRAGDVLELDPHLARLARAAERFDVPLPRADALRDAAGRLATEWIGDFGWIKIVATRGGTCAVFGGRLDRDAAGRPASAVLLRWRRSRRDPLAGWKTLNYAPFALGLEEARARGADEGLWCNDRGHLAEGCASSLFVVQQRKLYTASVADGILPGITRDLALRAARGSGLVVHEGKLRLKRLERADEAFLTSSVLGLRPLVRFEGRPVGAGEPGPVTGAIAAELERIRADSERSRVPADGSPAG